MSPDWDWKNFGKRKKKISPPPQKRRPPTTDSQPETPYRFKKRGCILRLTLIQHCHLKQITFFLRCPCVRYAVDFASPSCSGCWDTNSTRAFFSSSCGFVTSSDIKKFKVRSLSSLILSFPASLKNFQSCQRQESHRQTFFFPHRVSISHPPSHPKPLIKREVSIKQVLWWDTLQPGWVGKFFFFSVVAAF